jgi:hypothetical protein
MDLNDSYPIPERGALHLFFDDVFYVLLLYWFVVLIFPMHLLLINIIYHMIPRSISRLPYSACTFIILLLFDPGIAWDVLS